MQEIKLRGKSFPIMFDQRNVKEMQQKYGSLTALIDGLNGKEMDLTTWVVWILIREAVLFANYETGIKSQPPELEQIEQLITPKDIMRQEFADAIVGAFNEYLGGNVTGQQLQQAGKELLIKAQK